MDALALVAVFVAGVAASAAVTSAYWQRRVARGEPWSFTHASGRRFALTNTTGRAARDVRLELPAPAQIDNAQWDRIENGASVLPFVTRLKAGTATITWTARFGRRQVWRGPLPVVPLTG